MTSDRAAETERVIANVRAEIPPADQAQALRDLKRGADGEPQLDEAMLRAAAREIDAPLEACVDVFREVMHVWSMESRTIGALHDARGGRDADVAGLNAAIDQARERRDVAWRRIRPALRTAIRSYTVGGPYTAGAEALRKQAAQYLEAQAAAIEDEDALAAHVLRSAAAVVASMVVATKEGSETR